MFQTYEPVSDRSFAATHLPLIRAKMASQNLDAFIVPHDDEYQNEYIPAYAERLMWATGFSGSAGAAIIRQNDAVIFTDGRYTLQVRDQVDDSFFSFEDITEVNLGDWIRAHGRADERIGYDPMLHTVAGIERLAKAATAIGAQLIPAKTNPVDEAWTDQPAAPNAPVMVHGPEFAGGADGAKIDGIVRVLMEKKLNATVITAPPSVNWLFNIRGGDVDRTPLALSRALVREDGSSVLFIDPSQISTEAKAHLGSGVEIKSETDFLAVLSDTFLAGKKIGLDPTLTPQEVKSTLENAGAEIVALDDPCSLPRAVKNPTEQAGARSAHVRDGLAVTRFLHWLKRNAHGGKIDEIAAATRLEEFRQENNDLVDLSFDSISGAGPNGAIVHYRVTTLTNRPLKDGELFLIDSGGQYRDGTTDITRTVAIGKPTQEMKERFTHVLKGHIALATVRFPEGTTGHQLDSIARTPLWAAGLDYDHGTGHGVGSFLGVHEGPQRIAKTPNDEKLRPGMILSNEPGFYKTGEYGIRIENLVIVTPPTNIKGGERPMMGFETITLAPIDLNLVVPALLTPAERHWLNEYHARVRQTHVSSLEAPIADWLTEATRSI
ncbi:MAG: aminopeptidase P family protein [Pseudomonadota bacterium]